MNERVGISILTNGSRVDYLEECVRSLVTNCHYRPLVIGIYSNGSTDDTADYLSSLPEMYGVEWRTFVSDEDGGCAKGTNESIKMVGDCELQIHLESDFELLSPEESGFDKMWLHRAVAFMNEGDCDYLYLRRMRDEQEAAMHWWGQWMPHIDLKKDEYLRCPGFWWSNNPVLFRLKAMKVCGVLPLDELKDGPKGTAGWSQPELQAARPSKTWIHEWGVFIHERKKREVFMSEGCKKYGPFGCSGCKYGFWKNGKDRWCKACDHSTGREDMPAHFERARANIEVKHSPVTVAFHSNQLSYRGTEVSMFDYAKYNEDVLGNKSVIVANGNSPFNDPDSVRRFQGRFPVFMYNDIADTKDWLEGYGAQLGYMIKSGENDGLLIPVVKQNSIHCVFPVHEPHGDVYAYVARWTRDWAGLECEWVPHVMEFPEPKGDMRAELGIPRSAVVLGNIGDVRAMDLDFARMATLRALNDRPNLWVVLVNVQAPELVGHPRFISLPRTINEAEKARFVATCDGMLHARVLGENCSLSVGEFSTRNKPVITWDSSEYKGHIDFLQNKGVYYNDSEALYRILMNFKKVPGDYNAFKDFTADKVMAKFKKVFL